MALTPLDVPTLTAVQAAQSQATQLAALAAPWAGGNVTVRMFQGATLLETETYGSWVFDANTPRGMTLGPLIARTFVAAGAPDTVVFRSGSTDIFKMLAGVGSGDVNFALSVTSGSRSNLADAVATKLTITGNAALPVALSSLTFSVPSAGTTTVPVSGALINTSGVPCAWSITVPTGLTITPSSGFIAGGATQTLTVTGTAPGTYSLSVAAPGATITGNPQTIGVTNATVATAFRLTVPATGTNGAPGTVLVTPLGGPLSAACTVTLSATNAGVLGTTTLNFATGATTGQYTTISRSVTGASVISMSNSLGLTNTGSGASFTTVPGVGVVVGAQITSLNATNLMGSGLRPYVATVRPLRGQVPAGSTIASSLDSTLRASILSTHSDGSAAMVVVSGSTTGAGIIPINVATGSDAAALTPTVIGTLVSAVVADFGPTFGVISITNFDTPERIWWANSKTICARYRVTGAGVAGTALEAVIDIQAFDTGRALVEVQIENCKMNTASPVAPATAGYTAAVVRVNGTQISPTVNATLAVPGEGGHSPFRAWYASTWVGGNPGLRVTQNYLDLQKDPLFFQCDQACALDLTGYGTDAYTPFANVRQAASGMGATGDSQWIGPLALWDALFLQTGDARAANSVEQNALAVLSFNVNYRDATTGLPPTLAELSGKSQQSNWPRFTNADDGHGGILGWDVAHQPAAGLMAFICRPSPVYIEIAQKIAVWSGTYSTYQDSGIYTTTGVFGQYYQVRGRAWGLRNLAHATALSLDGSAWKASGRTSLAANFAYLDGFRTYSGSLLNVVWNGDPTHPLQNPDYAQNGTFNESCWQNHYLITEAHKVASAKLVATVDQAAADTTADWLAGFPVRWVNEQPNGGWRYVPYTTQIGASQSTLSQYSTWTAERAAVMTDTPSSVSGVWESCPGLSTSFASFTPDAPAGPYYPSYFWSALAAATERGISGSSAAWSTVQANITNLPTWRAGFASDPRWGSYPRSGVFFTSAGTAVGTLVSNVWTPARTGGVVNQASWDSLPTQQWIQVAGSSLNAIQSAIDAVVPGWSGSGTNTDWLDWGQSWSGIVPDESGGRFWLRGGGHSNGTNDGTYRFDGAKMAWDIEEPPTSQSLWSASYVSLSAGDSGTDQASASAYASRLAAGTLQVVNDYFRDEHFNTHHPLPRHTYEGMVYLPDRNEIIMISHRMWRYSLASKTWTERRSLNDSTLNPEYLDTELIISVYDERTGVLSMSSLGSTYGGNGRALQFNVNSEVWGTNGLSWQRNRQTACRNGRDCYFFTPPTGGHDDGWYHKFNLDTGVVVNIGDPGPGVGFQYAGGLSQSSFASGSYSNYYDGAGVVYVPPLNRFWMTTQGSDGQSHIYEINPTTTPWTISPGPTTGAALALQPVGKKRMMWVPTINAMVCCPGATAPNLVYKF